MAKNAAVSALLKPTAQHGRNNFPLDNKHVYSIKAGQVTPIKALHYEPGSYFDIKASDFTMTFPMQTAPFLRGRKETAFYSVYYNAVWSLYNQYQATKLDPKTSAFGKQPYLVEPRMSLFNFYAAIYDQFFGYFFYNYYIEKFVRIKLSSETEAVIQRCIALAKEDWLGRPYFYQDGCRATCEFTNSGTTYTIDLNCGLPNEWAGDWSISYNDVSDQTLNNNVYKDIVGHWRVYNWIRKLDMLGYGNQYSTFRSMENAMISVYDGTIATTSYLETTTQMSFQSLANTLFKQAHTFDGVVDIQPTNIQAKYVNLYPICAYNSIFYHFFRNSYYDLNYHPNNYNLDFVSVNGGTSTGIVTLHDFSIRFLDIEYHQWKKDTFTGVLPDTQFGAVSSISLTVKSGILGNFSSNSQENILFGNSNGSLNRGSLSEGTPNVISSKASVGLYGSTSFDIIALKRAEMLQDYRQQLMRAGNRTSDVFKAIYGGAPSSEHEDDVIPRFLDTFGEDLFVDPVLSTADTAQGTNGNLGDIAARGKCSGQSGHIKFNSGNNFGLILALTYFVPTAEYNSYMFDKHIFELTPEAHFIPQFENLGLEPIYSDELNSLLPASDIQVLGYGPRYYHKKSEVDQVHGAFVSLAKVRARVSEADDPLATAYIPEQQFLGDFNNWVSPRTEMQCRNSTALRDFYINPSVLDNVFVRAAGADIADDQFICNTYFEINATKEMSKVGLINFV